MDSKSGLDFKRLDILGLWSWYTNRSQIPFLILFYNLFYLLYQLIYLCVVQSVRMFIDTHELEVTVEKFLTICIDMEPCVKIIVLLCMEKEIKELLQVFRRDFLVCAKIVPEKALKIFEKSDELCNKVTFVVYVMVWATLLGYQVAPLTECFLSDCKYLKTIPDWHPFDESRQPAKILTFLVDSGSLWFTCLSECSIMLLVLSFSSAFGSQIDVLACCVESVREVARRGEREEEDEAEEMDRLVKECIRGHQQMLRIADLMESVFSLLNLFQMLLSTILICTCGFMLMIALTDSTTELSETPVQSFIRISKHLCFFSSMILQLTIFSWAGFVVNDKTGNLQEVFYRSDWTGMSQKTKRQILIAMTRANKPSNVTAGKFYVVSLQSYAAIMRASYTYFTMLYRLTAAK
ncbi:odorant receptor 4 [Nilaparvata lugens]|uniref:odorant receptor 4 n=1 Tax=Nilaparvata lugens TaxID=108931 RepID=UPI00193CB38B|nr:odorant receptor 4 [Nilaparvata lugens]